MSNSSGLSARRPSQAAASPAPRGSDGRNTSAYIESKPESRVTFSVSDAQHRALKLYAAEHDTTVRELGEQWIRNLTGVA